MDETTTGTPLQEEPAEAKKSLKEFPKELMDINTIGIEAKPLMVIDAVIGGLKVRALVDSGAAATLISKDIATRLPEKIEKREGVLIGIAGQQSGIGGVVNNMHFNIHGLPFKTVPILVVEGNDIPYPVILGADFFRENAISIDMANNRLMRVKEDGATLDLYFDKDYQHCRKVWRTLPCIASENAEIARGETAMVGIEWPILHLKCESCQIEQVVEEELYYDGTVVGKKFNGHIQGVDGLLQRNCPGILLTKSCDSGRSVERIRKGDVVGHLHTLVEEEEITITPSNMESLLRICTVEEDVKGPRYNIGDQLSEGQAEEVARLIERYPRVMSKGSEDIGCYGLTEYRIVLYDSTPIRQRARRFAPPLADAIEKQCEELLASDIIEPSESPWASPVVPVRKPDGSLRLCIDYRRLNAVTKPDRFPLPNLTESVYSLHGTKYMTSLDLVRGFYQVPIEKESRELTAFTTPKGHYQFKRLSFGLINAPSAFQREMQRVLAGLPVAKVLVYIDDILVLGSSFEEHVSLVQRVFQTLEKHGLKIKVEKCNFFQEKVKFLGHLISSEGVRKDPAYIESLKNYKKPATITEMRSLLGIVNFQRRFMSNASEIMEPLSASLGKGVKKRDRIVWTPEMNEAYDKLMTEAQRDVLLAYPTYEEGANPLELYVDASGTGMGACLMQHQEGSVRIIGFASSLFNKAERNYSTTDRELAALRWAVKSFRAFLYGVPFIIHTDHASLVHLHTMSQESGNGRLTRTLTELAEFDFIVKYVRGADNTAADGLSRLTGKQEEETEQEDDVIETPPGCTVYETKGGGDSLFDSVIAAMDVHPDRVDENMDNSKSLREYLVDELVKSPTRYGLQRIAKVTSKLKVSRRPGRFPLPEVLLAFSYLYHMKVMVHHGIGRPVLYYIPVKGFPEDEVGTIHLQCLAGCHYNGLVSGTKKGPTTKVSVYWTERVEAPASDTSAQIDEDQERLRLMRITAEKEAMVRPVACGCGRELRFSATINDHTYCTVWDTGASISMISEETITKEGIDFVKVSSGDEHKYLAFGGHRLEVIGRTYPLVVRPQAMEPIMETPFLVVRGENLQYCLVLGADVLNANRIIVAFGLRIEPTIIACAVLDVNESAEEIEDPEAGKVVIIESPFVLATQRRSRVLSKLYRVIRDGIPPARWGKELKSYKRYHSGMIIREGAVCYRTRTGKVSPVLTFELLVDITVTYHVRMGHSGRDKLQAGVEGLMWNPKVGKVVRELCATCAVCQTMKIGHQLTVPPTVRIQASDPFDLVSADLMEMPLSNSGNCAVLVVIDHFSKWVAVVAIEDKKSETVSNAFREKVFPSLLRLPRRILTDNGSEFIAGPFRQLLESMNIQHIKTTPLTPAANGEVERMNRSLQELMRGYGAKSSNWDLEIPRVVMAYNNTRHSSIDMSPAQSLLTKAYNMEMGPLISAEDQGRWRVGHPAFTPFKVGQLVMKKQIFKGRRNIDKLVERYTGPYRVAAVKSCRVAYDIIPIDNQGRVLKAHHRTLRPWTPAPKYLYRCPLFKEECTLDSWEELNELNGIESSSGQEEEMHRCERKDSSSETDWDLAGAISSDGDHGRSNWIESETDFVGDEENWSKRRKSKTEGKSVKFNQEVYVRIFEEPPAEEGRVSTVWRGEVPLAQLRCSGNNEQKEWSDMLELSTRDTGVQNSTSKVRRASTPLGEHSVEISHPGSPVEEPMKDMYISPEIGLERSGESVETAAQSLHNALTTGLRRLSRTISETLSHQEEVEVEENPSVSDTAERLHLIGALYEVDSVLRDSNTTGFNSTDRSALCELESGQAEDDDPNWEVSVDDSEPEPVDIQPTRRSARDRKPKEEKDFWYY